MGSVTDARIAGWQKEAGIVPAIGVRHHVLTEISSRAYDLIRIIELERSGIRDGNGSWHGNDVLDSTVNNLIAECRRLSDDDLCPRCGAHMQATHHPLCEARDGTPTELSDAAVRSGIRNGTRAVTERRSKESLLAHYATREPKSFVQIDGWYGGKHAGDSVIATDDEGRSMTSSLTTELMNGADMRLLIAPGADSVEIVALLHQAAEWITGTPDILDRSSSFHNPAIHLVEPREDDGQINLGRMRAVLDVYDNLARGAPQTSVQASSPLAELIAKQLREAIDSGDPARMEAAARLAGEAGPAFPNLPDSELPF